MPLEFAAEWHYNAVTKLVGGGGGGGGRRGANVHFQFKQKS